jgi:hypothetical protein
MVSLNILMLYYIIYYFIKNSNIVDIITTISE